MKKLFVSLIIATVILSSIVLAVTNQNIETKPIHSTMKRVIADTTIKQDIESFKAKGCLIKHKLRDSTTLDCPEDIVPTLNVRESRVFHILDLNADKQIGADKVWAEGITGSGVKVAILDTGIDTDHPELKDSYLGGYDYVNNDPYPEDDHGHGTHVSGIITSNGNDANSKGVAPGAGIYMYKVCNAAGNCYEDDMMAAMEAVVQVGAKVMSISIGGGSYTTENCDSDPLAAKVNLAVSQGITAVIAAGNDGKGVSSPGCASGAIAIGAVDSSNNVVYFSGRGPALDIVAPGYNIYSTLIGGYGRMSGTSMATPHVSGVVALLLETKPTLTTNEIKTALYSTASPVNKCYNYNNVEVSCTRDITGAGVVNAYNAYLSVKPTQQCLSDPECDDHLYCNGIEKCINSKCQAGTPVDCSYLNGQCSNGVCDETQDKCVAQPKPGGTSCNDGLFCTNPDTCTAGVCGGPTRSCDDEKSCTSDSCNEVTDVCENVWPSCGLADGCCGPICNSLDDLDCVSVVKCWSASYQYLYGSSSQFKKFCKCAMGTYRYNSYSTTRGTKTVYYYTNTADNTNWAVSSMSSSYPIYRVKCSNNQWYTTNKDYFR